MTIWSVTLFQDLHVEKNQTPKQLCGLVVKSWTEIINDAAYF